jgi:hypothetical protein
VTVGVDVGEDVEVEVGVGVPLGVAVAVNVGVALGNGRSPQSVKDEATAVTSSSIETAPSRFASAASHPASSPPPSERRTARTNSFADTAPLESQSPGHAPAIVDTEAMTRSPRRVERPVRHACERWIQRIVCGKGRGGRAQVKGRKRENSESRILESDVLSPLLAKEGVRGRFRSERSPER